MADVLHLVVAERHALTPSVTRFVLRDPAGAALPGYRGGAHVTVTTPAGPRRSYSLVDAGSRAPREYAICVRRDAGGRGGSVSMHDDVHPGDVLEVTWPANNFALKRARRYLFIAGGIGITPIRAMVAELRARGGAQVEVLYLSRSPDETAFLDEFSSDGTLLHHSAARGRLDLWPHLADPDGGDGTDTRVYCCGPTALVEEVLALTAHWRPSRVHVEDFAGVDPLGARPVAFTAVWEPTGARVEVPADRSLLTALRERGVDVDASCESGTCGTCRLRLVAGEAEHRDLVLTGDERERYVMPCVSRCLSGELVLAPATTARP
ncbi:PDR/VanB family oxidoreductase [Kineococcus radiotolerans]|uniref:Ferredoxin n=1 Tax=Kineococcus radiotolerans (strain ATCC BAA-149 / DSM 14245 / SRS30216) TaxID=266940 RepID=A6W7B9_KINRD|nr:PDR/VanB family oxidoreductase [Kineococcus radiotolerans]ABS02708.1 ferredoxin [Kineococcus radiotolerans SRS30216 = ATCC BAA-149]